MFNPLKMAEMLTQANKIKEELQQKLEQTMVEGESGGGAVRVTMNGKKQLLKVRIDPAAVVGLSGTGPNAGADVEMLEDLVTAAVNDAGRKADDVMQASARNMLGGLNFPGLT